LPNFEVDLTGLLFDYCGVERIPYSALPKAIFERRDIRIVDLVIGHGGQDRDLAPLPGGQWLPQISWCVFCGDF
jgi:hypothetical protein